MKTPFLIFSLLFSILSFSSDTSKSLPLCNNPEDLKICEPHKKYNEDFKALLLVIDTCKNLQLVKNSMCYPYQQKSKYEQVLDWKLKQEPIKSNMPPHCACF